MGINAVNYKKKKSNANLQRGMKSKIMKCHCRVLNFLSESIQEIPAAEWRQEMHILAFEIVRFEKLQVAIMF